MEDKISIIVPIYKVEQYLERCVSSIRAQSHRNLEIILVDDGSPDGCGRMIDGYALEDNRIRVVHKPNGGLSDARNAGIDLATADYVGFIDSDDFIHPDMFSDLWRLARKHDADIVQCSFRTTTADTPADPGGAGDEKVIGGREAMEYIYTPYGVDYVMVCDKLYRKKLFDDVRFPKSKIHEDEFTTWKLLLGSERVVVTGRKYYNYYQSPNSIIRSGFRPDKLHYAEAIEERIGYFTQHGMERLRSLAVRRYARWILIFMYINRDALRQEPAIRKLLQEKYADAAKMVSADPSVPARLKTFLRLAPAAGNLAGFLLFQEVYRRNFISRFTRRIAPGL